MAGQKRRMPKSLSHQTGLPNLSQTNSASLAQAEREVKVLQEENQVLKEELRSIRSMYKQLVTENTHESYDERRVNLLKSQIIQLERQLLLHDEALSSRSEVLLEVENAISSISDCCRSYISQQDRVGSVTVNKHDLETMRDIAESTRLKLCKTVERNDKNKLEKPLLFMDKFVKHNPWEPVTLMDICSGNIQHLNLKHVSKLESQLSLLYKELSLVQNSLQSIAPVVPGKPANKHVPHTIYNRLGAQVTKANDRLRDVTSKLLDLTVLVPAAPWPALKTSFVRDMTVDNVVSNLPNFPKSKAAEGKERIGNLLKAMNYTVHMAKLESQCLKDEVKFHQDLYHLQLEYIDRISEALRDGYMTFEENTHALVCTPMKEVFEAYAVLRDSATEESLRHFLSVFRKNAENISSALEKISSAFQDKEAVNSAMMSYREEFQLKLNEIHEQCTKDREKVAAELGLAKEKHRDAKDLVIEQFSPGMVESKDLNQHERTDTSQGKFNMDLHISSLNDGLGEMSVGDCSTSRTTNREQLYSDKMFQDVLRNDGSTERHSSLDARPPWDSSIAVDGIAEPSSDDCNQANGKVESSRRNDLSNRPAWDSSITVDGLETSPGHNEDLDGCTCGASNDFENQPEKVAENERVDYKNEKKSKGMEKPPTKPAKKKKQTPKPGGKPPPGVPQSRLVLKPTRQSSMNTKDSEPMSDVPNGRTTLSPIRRSGSLSSITSERSITPIIDASPDYHRNPRARERRAESLQRSMGAGIAANSSPNIDKIYPTVPSSSNLKNSLGLDKPWK